jgi:hypothetical protein
MYKGVVAFIFFLLAGFSSQAQHWTHVGPLSTNLQPVNGGPNLFETGQINLVEVNPWNKDHIVCGGKYAGLWSSTNGGEFWERIPTQQLGSNGVGAIHFISRDELLVTNLHQIIGGIKKAYSEGIQIFNFKDKRALRLPNLPDKEHVIFDALTHQHAGQTIILLATSKGLYRSDSTNQSWIQLTSEPVQSLKTFSDKKAKHSFLVFSGTDKNSGSPKLNLISVDYLFQNKLEQISSILLPVYVNDIMRMNNSNILSSVNMDCLVEFGEFRNTNDFDLFLLSDQEVTFNRRTGDQTKTVASRHLMLYKVNCLNGLFQEPIIVHYDTHLSNLTGARTGLFYDEENRGVWFSGVRLHFAFDPAVSDRKIHNIRSGFKTGKGYIHDDIHELRIYSHNGKRYLIAACDGGIARSELPVFTPEDKNIEQLIYFENLNNGLHVMLVNGFSGASKDPNFYVVGGFDISNTDFFRADLGRNEHTESTWENAGGLIDLFDNSRIIIDVSLYSHFYRVVHIDENRKYSVSENRTFHAPINPGEAPIRANKGQFSASHNEVIGFQPRIFVQDPYRPGRIFYVKHKVGLHQFDLESGLFVRKLDLAEMNPEPEWAGWSHDWRWWRSVSFSPQTPNSMHIIVNGSDNPDNKIQNPMVIKYIGDNLDACFGLDHTRFQNGKPQWKLISERFFNRFNRIMGTNLSREQIRDIDLIDIATSTTNKNKVYLMMRSKEAPSAKMAVFTGSRWINYSQGLPDDEYAMAMVLDYKTNDGIYLATDKNIYYRDADMKAWISVTGNFPKLNVEQLEINYVDNTLRAGTFGLGIWKMPLYKKVQKH